jgi:hypothetical protein
VDRSNIKTDRYEELIEIFRTEGLPVSSDLLLGLPGSTVTSFKKDLQFFIDRQVHIVAYPLRVLPNSPMGESSYMQKFDIKVDDGGYVVSTSSFSSMDLWTMKMLFAMYRGAIGYSVLKYLLYFLQVNNGIKAADFIHALTEQLMRSGEKMPVSFAVLMKHCLANDHKPLLAMSTQDWQELYREILDFARKRFGVRKGTAIDTVVTAQIALMPRLGRTFPEKVSLPHDIVAYFRQFRWMKNIERLNPSTIRPLEQFAPLEFEIADPDGVCSEGWVPPMDFHQPPRWELRSALSAGREESEPTLIM